METRKNIAINKLLRDTVRNLQPYASARDEYVSDGSRMVFLDANENPFGDGLNRYPDPQQRELKRLLADRRGLDVSQLLLGNGSDEVLDLLFRAFCEPGTDNVITLPPTYGMYKVLAGVNGVENREVQLTEAFEPDVEGILAMVDAHSKMILLCSPNNPTANSFSEKAIQALLERFEGLVVLDEAYIDFATRQSWLEELAAWPNLVITQTLSKAYGMAGIRLGICFASPEVISILNRIKPPYNVNELTQQQALKVLSDTGTIDEKVRQLLVERKSLEAQLCRIPFVVKVYPSDANFLLVKMDDAGRRYKELLEHGIVVRNRSNQPLCGNCLRITVGTPEENKKLIEVLNSL